MLTPIIEGWNRYWFHPRELTAVNPLRIGICVVAALWLGSFLPHVNAWFGQSGFLSTRLAASLINFEGSARWQHWSPLWFTDSLAVYYAWLVIGILIALAAAVGFGGRISLAILLFWSISWAHRIAWLQGLLEPAIIASVAYLIIQPGTALLPRTVANETSTKSVHWTANLTLRLLQTQWWILVAAGLLSQLASLVWWRGEAAWWLASAERSFLLSNEILRGQASLTNAISHGMVVVQMAALWLVTVPAARSLGIVLAVLVSVIYGLFADHLLYALLLVSWLPAFRQRNQH